MSNWVIGGSKGIGAAVALQLAARGDVICFSRSNTAPTGCTSARLDLAAPVEEIQLQISLAVARYGCPYAVVISSGEGAYQSPGMYRAERRDARQVAGLDELYATNLRGPVVAASALMLAMGRGKIAGRILYVGSTVTERGASNLGWYAATKAGFAAWAACEGRRALREHGISIVTYNAPWTESPMTADIDPEIKRRSVKALPIGRFAAVEEIASDIVALLGASPWLAGGTVSARGCA